MLATVIELNDAGIAAYNATGLLLESPGYAVLDARSLLVGDEAYQRARLDPRRVNSRFWDRLSLEPLPKPGFRARNDADLVYAHLRSIGARIKADGGEVIFVVPGSYNRQQLGLLLGIARECALPVAGMVDAAVAAASEIQSPGRAVLYLDIQLHRTVLTQLEQGASLRRVKASQLPETGLALLRETWATAVVAAFVRATRFDPLHSAQTEQQLYDRLPHWLTDLQHESNIQLELPASTGKTYGVTLKRAWFAQAVVDVYQRIGQLISTGITPGERVVLLLSHRFRGLPGFAASLLSLSDLDLIHLEPDTAARGALGCWKSLVGAPGEPLRLVTELPLQDMPGAPRSQTSSMPPPSAGPTHVLYRDHAYPIGERPLVVGTDVPGDVRGLKLSGTQNDIIGRHCSISVRGDRIWLADHSTHGIFLNSQQVQGGAVLRTGDRIGLGVPREELQLITVVQGHGA